MKIIRDMQTFTLGCSLNDLKESILKSSIIFFQYQTSDCKIRNSNDDNDINVDGVENIKKPIF